MSKKDKEKKWKILKRKKNNIINNNFTASNEDEFLLLKKKLTKNSLFLISKENIIRNFILKITLNTYFLFFINFIVILSSIFLILETSDDPTISNIASIFSIVFWCIFTLECIFKVISFGFVLDDYTYLRDSWNIVDFIIVIAGIFNLFPQIEQNIFLIRIFKIFRSIKSLSVIPSMKAFITSILISIIDLFIFFIILLFFFIIFALVGINLWSDIFDYRCRTQTIPVNGTLSVDLTYKYLCGGQNLCSNESLCLSSKDILQYQTYFLNPKDIQKKFYDELYYPDLNYGLTNFRNFWNALYIVFQSTTLEGWSYIMYIIMSAHNNVLAAIYFIFLIILNNYFMLNLLVAILLFNFEKNYRIAEKIQNLNLFPLLKSSKSPNLKKTANHEDVIASQNFRIKNIFKNNIGHECNDNINLNQSRIKNKLQHNKYDSESINNINRKNSNSDSPINKVSSHKFQTDDMKEKVASYTKSKEENKEKNEDKSKNDHNVLEKAESSNSNIIIGNTKNIFTSKICNYDNQTNFFDISSNRSQARLLNEVNYFNNNQVNKISDNSNYYKFTSNLFQNNILKRVKSIPHEKPEFENDKFSASISDYSSNILMKKNSEIFMEHNPNMNNYLAKRMLNTDSSLTNNNLNKSKINPASRICKTNLANNVNKKNSFQINSQLSKVIKADDFNYFTLSSNRLIQRKSSPYNFSLNNEVVKNVTNYLTNENLKNNEKEHNNNLSQKEKEEMVKKYRKKYQPLEKPKMALDVYRPHPSLIKQLKEIPFFINFRSTLNYHKNNKLSFYCYYIINQPIVQYFVYFCIIFNFAILIIDRKGQSQTEVNFIELMNKILVFIFLAETFFLIMSKGIKEYFSNFYNIIDLLIVIFSLIEIIFLNDQIITKSNMSVASSFRILRIFRILKLIRSWYSFKVMIFSIVNTVKRMINFFILFLVFMYVYAIVGVNIFKGSLKFNDLTLKYDNKAASNFDNFDNFSSSYLLVFELIIGDGWYKTFIDCFRSEANSKAITIVYFISLILIGQISLLNIFLAYLIDNFKISRAELFKNTQVKEYMGLISKAGLEKHSSEIIKFHQRNRFKSPFISLVYYFANENQNIKEVIISSKLNFEAKIKINFKDHKQANESYFRRLKNHNLDISNKKNQNQGKNIINKQESRSSVLKYKDVNKIYDKSVDFEFLYKAECYVSFNNNDFLDFEYINNIDIWTQEKLHEAYVSLMNTNTLNSNEEEEHLISLDVDEGKLKKTKTEIKQNKCQAHLNENLIFNEINNENVILNNRKTVVIPNNKNNMRKNILLNAKDQTNKDENIGCHNHEPDNETNINKYRKTSLHSKKSKKLVRFMEVEKEIESLHHNRCRIYSLDNGLKKKNEKNDFDFNNKSKSYQSIEKYENKESEYIFSIVKNKENSLIDNLIAKNKNTPIIKNRFAPEGVNINHDEIEEKIINDSRKNRFHKKIFLPIKNFLEKYEFLSTNSIEIGKENIDNNDKNIQLKTYENYHESYLQGPINSEQSFLSLKVKKYMNECLALNYNHNIIGFEDIDKKKLIYKSYENIAYKILDENSYQGAQEKFGNYNSKENMITFNNEAKSHEIEVASNRNFNNKIYNEFNGKNDIAHMINDDITTHEEYLSNLKHFDGSNKFLINGDQFIIKPIFHNNRKKGIFNNLEFSTNETLNIKIKDNKNINFVKKVKTMTTSPGTHKGIEILGDYENTLNDIKNISYSDNNLKFRNENFIKKWNTNGQNDSSKDKENYVNKRNDFNKLCSNLSDNDKLNSSKRFINEIPIDEFNADHKKKSHSMNQLNVGKNLIENEKCIINPPKKTQLKLLFTKKNSKEINIQKLIEKNEKLTFHNNLSNSYIDIEWRKSVGSFNPLRIKADKFQFESFNKIIYYKNILNDYKACHIEDIKEKYFLYENNDAFNELLFYCLNDFLYDFERPKNFYDLISDKRDDDNFKNKEYINFDIHLKKRHRKTLGKIKLKDITANIFVKNNFNNNSEAFCNEYYINDPSLINKIKNIYILGYPNNQSNKWNKNNNTKRNSTNTLNLNFHSHIKKMYSLDFDDNNRLNSYKRLSYDLAGEKIKEEGRDPLNDMISEKDIYGKVKEIITFNNQINNNADKKKTKTLYKFLETKHKTISGKPLSPSRKPSFLKKNQHDNSDFSHYIYSNQDNNKNKQILETQNSLNIADAAFSSKLETYSSKNTQTKHSQKDKIREDFDFLHIFYDGKNNFIEELKNLEFNFNLVSEENFQFFLKQKNIYFKINYRPLFKEINLEKKKLISRMSIFNLIETPNQFKIFELLEIQVAEKMFSTLNSIIVKSATQYKEDKILKNKNNALNENKINPILQIQGYQISGINLVPAENFIGIYSFYFYKSNYELSKKTSILEKFLPKKTSKNFIDKLKAKIKIRKLIFKAKISNCIYRTFYRVRNYILNSSLGIFHKELLFRKFIAFIVISDIFQFMIMTFIFLNCIFLILDNPWNNPESWLAKAITITNLIFTFIFAIESIMKIIAFGLIFGQKEIQEKEFFKSMIIKDKDFELFGNAITNDFSKRRNAQVSKSEKFISNNYSDNIPTIPFQEINNNKNRRSNFSQKYKLNLNKESEKLGLNLRKSSKQYKNMSRKQAILISNNPRSVNFQDNLDINIINDSFHTNKSKKKISIDNVEMIEKFKSFSKQQHDQSINSIKNNYIKDNKESNNLNVISSINKEKSNSQYNKNMSNIDNLERNRSNISKNSIILSSNITTEETLTTEDSKVNKMNVNKFKKLNLEKYSGYLIDISNVIDFIVVMFGMVDVIRIEDIAAAKYLRTMRMLRSIRPIRIITKNASLKLIIACLIKSIPALGNILVIGILFILIYAAIGVNLFKNSLDFYCKNNFIDQSTCIEKNLGWFENSSNFNNILWSLKTLFELLTAQNWVWIMNLAYFKTSSFTVYFYFISYIIFAYLFILNLIVSVIVEKFKTLKEKKNKLFSLSEEEKDWIKVQKIMLKFNPKIKLNEQDCSYWQKQIYRLIDNDYFEFFTFFFIFFAIAILAIQHNGSDPRFDLVLIYCNYIITISFNLEIALKIFAYRKSFFASRWNIFDFIIIILCNLILVLNVLEQIQILSNSSKISTLPGIFRALRILRVLRLIAIYPNLRSLIDTLVYLIPSIINIGLIMIILFVIYGCIGVNLFGTVPYRESIHEYNNFRNFPNAVMLLFRVTTGDDWSNIMNELAYHDCRKIEDVKSQMFEPEVLKGISFRQLEYLGLAIETYQTNFPYFNYSNKDNGHIIDSNMVYKNKTLQRILDNNISSIFSHPNYTLYQSFLNNRKTDYYCITYNTIYCTLDDKISYSELTNDMEYSCGSNFSYIYFISFVIIGPIFVMNLCIVMVVEGFSESMYENESLLSQSEMDKLISVWINYDSSFTKKVKPYEMVLILKELEPPLGLNYDRFFILNALKANKYQKIKTRIKKNLASNAQKFLEEYKINNKRGQTLRTRTGKNILDEKNDIDRIKRIKTVLNLGFSKKGLNFGSRIDDDQTQNIFPLKIIKKGKNTYNFKNYFFNQNLKFWTQNTEVIRIVDFFGFNIVKSNIDQARNLKKNCSLSSEMANKINKIDDMYEGLNIHFAEACLSLSRFLTSKKHSILLDSLRERIVGKFTQKLWKKKYNYEGALSNKKKKLLSEALSIRVIGKIKPKLRNLLENARRKIYLRNLENHS